MRAGDRIAIKRMLGYGSPNIAVRALGVIKEVDDEENEERTYVYVDWFEKDLEREVPSRGAFNAIHGPYTAEIPGSKRRFVSEYARENNIRSLRSG